MSESWLLGRLGLWIPLILSLSVHEWAHAWSAWRLGDDTAARLGRLTLNPLAHLDPIGTVLLPLVGVPFGWAKPVPVNPVRFDRRVAQRSGLLMTAAAGPISNLALALGCAVLLLVAGRFAPALLDRGSGLGELVRLGIHLNLILAVFNLLPIPPLDGSLILDGLLQERLRPLWERFQALGPVALAVVIVAPALFGMSLLAWPLEQAERWLEAVLVLAGP